MIFCTVWSKKIKEMPLVGKKFTMIPVMISLVKNYVQGKYTTVPYGTILAVLSALIYFLSPIDIIPDFIPLAGYLDDMAVVGLQCGLKEYRRMTWEGQPKRVRASYSK